MMRCEKRTEKEDEEEEVKMKEQKKDKEERSAALILRFALKVFWVFFKEGKQLFTVMII